MGSFIGGCPCIARDGRRSRRTRQRDSGWPGAGRSGPLSPSRPGVGSRGPRPPRPARDGGPALDAAFVRAVAWRRGEDESGTHREMNRRALCAAVLAVACSAAFGRTAGHGFLFWDDRAFIAENPLIAHPSAASLLALWTTPLEDLYAPLTYTLWGLLAAVVGPKPWAFHLTNVALHALNAGLVFAVLRRLVTEDDGRAALAGALLFALHPVQSEAVAWASETKDLLSALFSLLAIRQYLVFRERENPRAYLWASGAFACALLAKPSAVVAPALLVILNRGIHRPRATCTSWRPSGCGRRSLWMRSRSISGSSSCRCISSRTTDAPRSRSSRAAHWPTRGCRPRRSLPRRGPSAARGLAWPLRSLSSSPRSCRSSVSCRSTSSTTPMSRITTCIFR